MRGGPKGVLLGVWAGEKVGVEKAVGAWGPVISSEGSAKMEWFDGSWATKLWVSYGSAWK